MSGSYLLVEYRYAWILTLYHLIKPAVLFGDVPQFFDMLNDFYKYSIVLWLSVPAMFQFKILHFAFIIWIIYKLLLNSAYFNNYFLVRVISGAIRDVVIKYVMVLFS